MVLNCYDCQQQRPFARNGKMTRHSDTNIVQCDNPECNHGVCHRHLRSMNTIGDFCHDCAEYVKAQYKID
jgi:hypothetical protein